ncbi:MAG: 2-hydroxyacyl-CoA dehydratase subunit D [Candidatus Baldrarchaeia archaeon]
MKKVRRSLRAARRITNFVIAHYLSAIEAHRRNKWVAWCTAVPPPIEILYAMDIQPLFPENYACVCAVRKETMELFRKSEADGYLQDLCSYARCVIGFLLGGKAPLGGMEKPDFLLSTKNVCSIYLKWWQVMSHYLKKPLLILDCPRITDKIEKYHIEYVKDQLVSLIEELEKITGESLDINRLRSSVELSRKAAELWHKSLDLRKNKPCPMGVTDASAAMFPYVVSAGARDAVEYYKMLYEEVKNRVKEGIGVVDEEKYRLVLSGIPYWHNLRLFNYLEEKYGAVFVYELYTATWGIYKPDPSKPLESLAYKSLFNPINLPGEWTVEWIVKVMKEYDADGVIMLSSRSCKATSLLHPAAQKVLSKEYDIPCLIIEADHTDERAYSDAQVKVRLDAFMEMLEARKEK